MANGGLTTAINGPLLTPPKISLISSAQIVNETDERWYAGFSYKPDGCGEAALYPLCPDNTVGPKEFCRGSDVVDFTPYIVYGSDTCSTWGHAIQDYMERARRRLLAAESYWLELVLWGGPNVPAYIASLDNPTITGGATVVTGNGAVEPVNALAALEDALGDCQKGNRAMIHMRPGLLTRLAANADVIRREGNVWLTATDNIVVPGRGYEGTGPAGQAVGATEWMYATGMVQVRRGPVVAIPSDDDNMLRDAVNRSTNDVEVLAERVVHAAFDPSCCVLAAEVTR